MKSQLALAALLTFTLTANIARADIDYEDLLNECREATRDAMALSQAAQNLPSDFPDRVGFQTRAAGMANELQATTEFLQGVVDGDNPEWNAQRINRNLQLVQDLRGDAVQWIESEARRIEGNYDGMFVDLAINMRRLAGEVDNSLREMESEIR